MLRMGLRSIEDSRKPIRLRECISIKQDNIITLCLPGCQVVAACETEVFLRAEQMKV